MLVAGVVVHHQVQLNWLTVGIDDMTVRPLDLLQEHQELLVPVTRFECGGDLTGGDVQRREQGAGAVRP